MGPVQSVMTVGFMGRIVMSCSFTSLIGGATFGVGLRSVSGERILSIVLGSRLNLNGLRGGGGPGPSDAPLRGYNDEAILDAR